MIEKLIDTTPAAPLFGDWKETIIWSCLEGIMGEIFADSKVQPVSAMAVLGDFTFFAGVPNQELIQHIPGNPQPDFMLMVPQNELWGQCIEKYFGTKAKKVQRYAIKKEPNIFDTVKLKQAVENIAEGYTLSLIDEALFERCRSMDWSTDLVSQFPDYQVYAKKGIGVVALKDGVPVSGASSYSRYRDGIEIEVDTQEHYRRKGLAYACSAKLILECQKRNLYPSWDAQNPWSVALAEKLGYHFDHTYDTYVISYQL